MTAEIKRQIEACTTAAQVRKILKANGIAIVRDDTPDSHGFSVWLDEVTRIYRPYGRRTMEVQTFQKVRAVYSGIPVFFG